MSVDYLNGILYFGKTNNQESKRLFGQQEVRFKNEEERGSCSCQYVEYLIKNKYTLSRRETKL